MTHQFDDTGMCINPTVEFSHSGKYFTVQITSAVAQGGLVFGYYFRGVRAYKVEACRWGASVPPEDKKREVKRIIDSAVAFFVNIKYDEEKEIQSNRFDEANSRQQYEGEITALREKGENLFQLELF